MKFHCIALVFLMLGAGLVIAEETDTEPVEETKPPRVGHVDLEKHSEQALVGELRQSELVWLDVEYPTPEGAAGTPEAVKVLALQRPSYKPQQHGAVLLVPGTGQHADWPQAIRPLRSALPESGWYTLSVSLPGASIGEVPERQLPVKAFDEVTLSPELKDALNRKLGKDAPDSASSSSEDSEDGEAGEEVSDEAVVEEEDPSKPVDIDLADKEEEVKEVPYQDKALAHVNAGMNYLKQQGYQNIVLLAYHSSVNVALEYLRQKQGAFLDKGFAVVFVDPIFSEDYQRDLKDALGQNFLPPVLEVVNSEEDSSSVKARLASAKIAGATRYMQVKYAFQLAEGSQKTLVRRIRYWLERHAPGMIVGPR